MSEVRAFVPTYGAKKEVTVVATATAGTLIAKQHNGPFQVRLVNYDTVRVAYRFGDSTVTAVLASDPTLAPGATEVITVMPGNGYSATDIYFSIVSDTSPTGNKFEATPGQGV